MPTTNMARTVEYYGRLGFAFSAPASSSLAGAEFAIGRRDGIELHFALKQDHDPARTATWVYIRVEDADVMSEELTAAGAAQGRLVRTTDYNMRELAHIDPDGNLLLFGSPLPDPQDPARQETAGKPASPGVAAPPIQSALGYAQWAAVRRLWERGAETGLPHAAVLGLTETVTSLVETSQPPDRGDISAAFWNACRAGQLPIARCLFAHGAELDWPAPWDAGTPLDTASAAHQQETLAWLRDNGAHPGAPD